VNFNSVTQTLRLREYYYMLLRHKLVFAWVVAACVAIATVSTFFLQKIYRAETALLVRDEEILNPLISGLAISPSLSSRLRTLREELLSWQRLTLLVEQLKLDKEAKSPLDYERLIKNLRDNISVKMGGTQIITISFDGPQPKLAQNIVQTLSDIIIGGTITSQSVEASSAIRFIDDQLAGYRKKLEESEDNLRKFRELYSSTLPVATQMNQQLVNLKMELNNLLVENTEEHPRVIQTKQMIDALENQRDQQMKLAQEEGVDIAPDEYAKLISSVPRQEQHLSRLQRDYMVNANIYESLLQRLETAKLSETLEDSEKGPKFRILEPARLPLEPVKPRKILFVLGGFLIGIILGGMAVFLLELSNTSIRNLDEARNVLELPIFGSIPPILPEELLIQESLRRTGSV
jgi:polysaccharide biosynthesis transport protein